MTYNVYRYIFYGCVGAAIFCFVLAVVLFFVLDITGVIGNLTGSTAKKAIETIRNQSYGEAAAEAQASSGNKNKKKPGAPTAVMNPTSVMGDGMDTSKLSTGELVSEARASATTTLLEQQGRAAATSVLNPQQSGTPNMAYGAPIGASAPGYGAQQGTGYGAASGNAMNQGIGYGAASGDTMNQGADYGATSVLSTEEAGTTSILSSGAYAVYDDTAGEFAIDYDITYIHSAEVIS